MAKPAPALGPLARWLLLGLSGGLGAGAGCGDPGTAPRGEAGGAGEVATDSFLLRAPSAAARERLVAELARRGLAVRHRYGEAVGLSDTLSVSARAEEIGELLSAMPMPVEARAAVLRFPDSVCGNGSCEPDEAETAARVSTCSYDCGVPPPRALRDELDNAWHVRTVSADRAWAQTRGDGVHVAVLDTGYDSGPGTMHPDRPDNLGFGYNFPAGSPDYAAVEGHGTHVAGIIAAPRNGFGTVGVAPAAIIHPYQIFKRTNGRTSAEDADIIAALESAIRNGYQVVNMSLGGGRDSELEHLAIRKANEAGLLVVVAAGNAEDYASGSVLTAPSHFPGAYAESFSVGATDRAEAIADFSSTGRTVTVSAPGVSVYSTVPRGTGESSSRAVFDIQGVGQRQLQAQVPFGSSVTPVSGAPVVACGYGAAAEVDRCAPVGKFALVQRGPAGMGQTALTFVEKIENARSRGALGVIIYNHTAGDPATAGGLFGADIGTAQPVPIMLLASGDGDSLRRAIEGGAAVRVSMTTTYSDFDLLSGTSMATPVVSGVAALLWSRFPKLTNVELKQLLAESAVDLGAPGRDDLFGWGRVDAWRAIQQARPLGRCGDQRLDPASEICDVGLVGDKGCEDLGWDDTPGGKLACNARCTAVETGTCACQPGRAAFETALLVDTSYTSGGKKGVLATYRVRLGGKPVRGATAHITVRRGGALAFDYDLGPTDGTGEIKDFTPYDGTGMTPGTYEFAPVLGKAGGRCHDDRPTTPPTYTVEVKS